jgi:hypothetical protein
MMGYTKIIQSDKFIDLKIYILGSICFLVLSSLKYDAFEDDVFLCSGRNSWLNVNIFQFFQKPDI